MCRYQACQDNPGRVHPEVDDAHVAKNKVLYEVAKLVAETLKNRVKYEGIDMSFRPYLSLAELIDPPNATSGRISHE